MTLVVLVGAIGLGVRMHAQAPLRVCAALAERGIATVFETTGAGPRCDGVTLKPTEGELAAALAGPAPDAVSQLLSAAKASAIHVAYAEAPGQAVEARLARREGLPGLAALVLTPTDTVVYARPLLPLSHAERDAVAHVARAVLQGAREPSLASFPLALRKFVRVEVLVTLREHGRALLWRSARATSIARALLTASRVARDRFREREQSLGGPLAERLLGLDVEVSLLVEDGDLADVSRPFVSAVVTADHGIGFDHRGAWHYVLPSDASRLAGGKGPYEALVGLAADNGLLPEALGAEGTRVYRFKVAELGSSRAPLSADISTGSRAAAVAPGSPTTPGQAAESPPSAGRRTVNVEP
jgi:hypothetical protein